MDPLISLWINECTLYNNVEEIITYKFKYRNKACANCDYESGKISGLSAELFYTNIELANILNFEIIFENYNDIVFKYDNTIKIFKEKIEIYKELFTLKSIICIPTDDHYTVYLTNVKDNNCLGLDKNLNYYYNDLYNNGEIIPYDKTLSDLIKKKIGYIFIYEKEV